MLQLHNDRYISIENDVNDTLVETDEDDSEID